MRPSSGGRPRSRRRSHHHPPCDPAGGQSKRRDAAPIYFGLRSARRAPSLERPVVLPPPVLALLSGRPLPLSSGAANGERAGSPPNCPWRNPRYLNVQSPPVRSQNILSAGLPQGPGQSPTNPGAVSILPSTHLLCPLPPLRLSPSSPAKRRTFLTDVTLGPPLVSQRSVAARRSAREELILRITIVHPKIHRWGG